MADQCKGLAGLLFGHDYRPIFNKVQRCAVQVTNAPSVLAVERAYDAAADRDYIGHFCARCGSRIIKEL